MLPGGVAVEIDLSRIAVPPIFGWLARTGGVETREMLRTFNCGVGMVLVVASEAASAVRGRLAADGETVFDLGRVVARPEEGARVIFRGALDL